MLAERLKQGQPTEVVKLAENNSFLDFINVMAMNHKTAILTELLRQPVLSKPLITYCCAYCKQSFGPIEKHKVMMPTCPNCGGMILNKAVVTSELV